MLCDDLEAGIEDSKLSVSEGRSFQAHPILLPSKTANRDTNALTRRQRDSLARMQREFLERQASHYDVCDVSKGFSNYDTAESTYPWPHLSREHQVQI
jgi:hypothetical protein